MITYAAIARHVDPPFVHGDSLRQLAMPAGALGSGYDADFLSYEAPTRFGMLCTAFVPRQDEER